MSKKCQKNSDLLIIQIFYVNFQKFSLIFTLIFNLIIFSELPTVADYQVTQAYSRQIPHKVRTIHG